MSKSIGDRLDTLGIQATFNDDDLISSAVVVMTVLPGDGNGPYLKVCYSQGSTWIERTGMLHAAAADELADIQRETVERDD